MLCTDEDYPFIYIGAAEYNLALGGEGVLTTFVFLTVESNLGGMGASGKIFEWGCSNKCVQTSY